MAKITTADCKKAIEQWVKDDVDGVVSDTTFRLEENGPWIRLRKYNGKNGRIIREFARRDRDFEVMFVIEDNGVLTCSLTNPDDTWYFYFDPDVEDGDTEPPYAMIVSKSFYDREGGISDQSISLQVASILPEGFFEDCESMFSYTGTPDEARQQLVAAGFIENPAMGEGL